MKLFRIALPLLLCLLSLNCHAADDSAPRFDYWTTSNTLAQKSRNLDDSNAILDKLAALPELSPYEQLTLEILRNQVSGAFAGWGPNTLKTEQDAAWNIACIAREQAESIPEISAAANEALFSKGYSETGPSSDMETRFRLASSALDYWAGCTDIDKARIRYISLARYLFNRHKFSYSPDKEAYTQAVRTVLEQALRIATDDLTRIRLHMDLASSYAIPFGTSKDSPIADILRAQQQKHLRAAVPLLEARSVASADDLLTVLPMLDWQKGEDPVNEQALETARQILDLSAKTRLLDQYTYRDLKNAYDEITAPSINADTDGVFHPALNNIVPVRVRNLSSVQAELYRISMDDYIAWQVAHKQPKPDTSARTWSNELTDIPTDGHKRTTISVALKDMKPGCYQLLVSGKDASESFPILVSAHSAILNVANNQAAIYVCDLLDGTPAKGVNTELRLYKKDRQDTVLDKTLQAVTGEDGIAHIEIPIEKTTKRLRIHVATVDGDQPVFTKPSTHYGSPYLSLRPELKAILVSDRIAYRPGDTVHWKVALRTALGDKVEDLPEGTKVDVVIGNRRDETVLEETLDCGTYGSLSGSFVIPASAALGHWAMAFTAGELEAETSAFVVEEYRAPEFQAEFELPKEPCRPGETVQGKLKVRYMSGQPIRSASVKLRIDETSSEEYAPYALRYDTWLPETAPAKEAEIPPLLLDLVTDENGEAAFSFDSSYSDSANISYSLNATVTDASRREVTVHGWVESAIYPASLSARAEHSIVPLGEALVLNVHTSKGDGADVSLKGTLTPLRLHDSACSNDYEHERMADIAVETGAKGWARVELKDLPPGAYHFEFDSPETGCGVLKDTVFIGEPETLPALLDHNLQLDKISLQTDNAERKPESRFASLTPTFLHGETLRVLLPPVDDAAYGILNIQGNLGLRTIPVALGKKAQIIELKVLEGEYGTQRIYFDCFAQGTHIHWQTLYTVRSDPAPLKVELAPRDGEVPAGTEQALDIRVTHADGTSASGLPVVVRVYDHSLDKLFPELGKRTIFPLSLLADWDSGYWSGNQAASNDIHKFILPADEMGEFLETMTFRGLVPGYGGGAMGDDIEYLSPFEVLSESDIGYYAASTLAGTRLRTVIEGHANNIPLRQDFLKDTGATSVNQALEYRFERKAVQLRQDFRKTAFWQELAMTDAEGKIHVSFPVPDSLTAWTAEAFALGHGLDVGNGNASFTASVPISGRLQMPRFLVEGDEADLSVVANNNSKETLPVRISLSASPDNTGKSILQGETKPVDRTLAAGSSTRVDWRLKALSPGTALVTATAESSLHSDGMLMPLNIVEYGFAQKLFRRGVVAAGSRTVSLELPAEHRDGSAAMTFNAEVGLAPAMLRALPYLIDYPYTCSEQSTSRIVPLALMLNDLEKEGVERADILASIGIENEEAYDAIIGRAIASLSDKLNQRGGGFGWFSAEYPDQYISAYVLWGLTQLEDRGIETLNAYQMGKAREIFDDFLFDDNSDSSPALRTWILFSLTGSWLEDEKESVTNELRLGVKTLLKDKDKLPDASLAQLAMAAHSLKLENIYPDLIAQLEKAAIHTTEPGTGLESVHWGEDLPYYTWANHRVETTAWVLMALNRIEPDNALIQPAVTWLLKERESGRWESTRSTCISLVALEEVRTKSRPQVAQTDVDLLVNGYSVGTFHANPKDLASQSIRIDVPTEHLRNGDNGVEVRTSGNTPVFFDAGLRYFDKRVTMTPTESGIRLEREYLRIHERPTLAKGPLYDYTPMAEGESVCTGDRIEIRVRFTTANALHYLMLEDCKPAGFEWLETESGFGGFVVELLPGDKSGELREGNRRSWLYVEPRDRTRAAFIDQLPAGTWELRYQIRAETPGVFNALPARMEAMYSPSTCGSTENTRLGINP